MDEIRIDKEGRICLNDMLKYMPEKRVDTWKKASTTKDKIKMLQSEGIDEPMIGYRGKYGGGTFAHLDLAIEFGAFLSPYFRLLIYREILKNRFLCEQLQ